MQTQTNQDTQSSKADDTMSRLLSQPMGGKKAEESVDSELSVLLKADAKLPDTLKDKKPDPATLRELRSCCGQLYGYMDDSTGQEYDLDLNPVND
jgi:hypothetical protein